MSSIESYDDNNFQDKTNTGTTLVDFYAEWCGPCRTLTPVLENVAKELNGKVAFGKLDIDKNNVTAKNFNVTSVPTLVLIKDGKEVNRLVGLRDADAIKDFINVD